MRAVGNETVGASVTSSRNNRAAVRIVPRTPLRIMRVLNSALLRARGREVRFCARLTLRQGKSEGLSTPARRPGLRECNPNPRFGPICVRTPTVIRGAPALGASGSPGGHLLDSDSY